MSTLSNVSPIGDAVHLVSDSLATITPPIEKNYGDGVSVSNVPADERNWYVLRVSYGRINMAEEVLATMSFDYYIPYHYTKKSIGGRSKIALEPLLPGFVFVHATASDVDVLVRRSQIKGTDSKRCLSYYYDHFVRTPSGTNPPLTVRHSAMEDFIRLTSVRNEHIVTVSRERCCLRTNEQVLVTDGPFRGVRGCVARILGQQRVAVELHGVCVVATAYIPTAFLRVLKNDNI